MAGGHPPPRDDADLHRLVDGLLDSRRLGEVLLRLKSQTAEAARVAAWREQNDLIKAAFAGVDQEAIPPSLRLTPLRLRCLGDDRPIEPASPPRLAGPVPLRHAWPAQVNGWPAQASGEGQGRRGTLVATACCALAAAALAASWLALARPSPSGKAIPIAAGEEGGDLLVMTTSDQAEAPHASELPTATIPDLGPLGFSFTGATSQAAPQRMLVFSYQNGAAGRLTLSVSRPRGAEPVPHPGAIAWKRDGRSFQLGGTLEPERMALVAGFLQAADPAP